MSATIRKAPYRHKDGSNCWTKSCSRDSIAAPVTDFNTYFEARKAAERNTVDPVTQLPTKEFVHKALKKIGNKLLKSPYKEQWTEDNPSLGYCYVVSEAFYHYGNLGKVTPFVLSFPEGGTHWWLKTADGRIIDYTADQFDFEIDYSAGTRCPFFKGGVETSTGFISKRGQIIAETIGLTK